MSSGPLPGPQLPVSGSSVPDEHLQKLASAAVVFNRLELKSSRKLEGKNGYEDPGEGQRRLS